jgi:outer membrane protein W
MKKIFCLFVFLCIQSIGHSQFNVGANAILQLPQGHFKNISKLGYGGSASIGYTFAQRVDLSFVYTRYEYTSSADFFKLNSKTVEAKFFFLNGNTRPYIGCGVGLFSETFVSDTFPRQTENNWGFEPKAGILLDSKLMKDLFVDGSIS